MWGWKRTLVFGLAVVLVNVVTYVVVVENQHAGLYPIDADSIGIPIMSTLSASVLVLPPLILIGLAPGSRVMARLCSRGLPWRIGLGLLLLVLYAVVSLFALGGLGYWSVPNHYVVAVSYAACLLALALFFVLDLRWLLSNSAPQPDSGGASHFDRPSQPRAAGSER